MKKWFTVKMPDGSVWGVPTEMIARSRAANYADEFGNDIERSLKEDTLPLFEKDRCEIDDWAVNNMNWSDFDGHQVKLSEPNPKDMDFEKAWMNGEKGFAE